MSLSRYTHQDLVQADNAIKEAQISLQCLVRDVYPVGTEVSVKFGRYLVRVKISDHGRAYWSGAGDLFGVNVQTGKVRRFHYGQIVSTSRVTHP